MGFLQLVWLLLALVVFVFFVVQRVRPSFFRIKIPYTFLLFLAALLLTAVLFFGALPDAKRIRDVEEVAAFPFTNIVGLAFQASFLYICTRQGGQSSFLTYAENTNEPSSFLKSSDDHALRDDSPLQTLFSNDWTAFVVDSPLLYFVDQNGTLFQSALATPTVLSVVYQNASIVIQCLATNGTHLFLSADKTPVIVLDKQHPTQLKYVTGPDLHHAGIFYSQHVLYVCESYRVLAFRNNVLVRIYEPVYRPLHLTVWQNQLVVAALDRTYFFDLKTARQLPTLTLPSMYLAASSQFLYVANSNGITVLQ